MVNKRVFETHSVYLRFKTSFFPKVVTSRQFKMRHNRYKWMSFSIGNFSENFMVLPPYRLKGTRLKQRSKKHCTGVTSDSDVA